MNAQFRSQYDSEGRAQFRSQYESEAVDLVLVTDVDAGNASPTLSSVTNAADQSPTVFVDTRSTASGGTGGTGWRHILFAVEDAGGKTPVFRLNRATMDRNTQAIGTEYRPSYTADFKTWVQAPSRTLSGGSSGYIEFQFTDPLPSGRIYVCSQPIAPNLYAETFAAELLSDYSAVASPAAQADGSGVYNVTPVEQDDLGREIGGNNQYAIKLAFGGSTTDGGPKRKLVALAGIHAAGEQVSWIPYESFIRWALDSQTQEAANLRANWDVWLYFNITPNGLKGGHRRHNFRSSVDPNRDFVNRQLQEIDALRTAVETEVGTCDCFLSFHGYNGGDGTLYIPGYYTGSGQETQDFISIGQTVFGVAPLSYGITSTDTDMAWGTTVLNAPVSVAAEFWSRDHTSYERLHSDGEKWAQTLQAADAQGLFYQPETEVSLAAVESGGDAFAFSASVQVETRLQAAEAGADSAAMAASCLVGVQAAATEQGSDSTAMAASLVTAASLAVTEAGLDLAGLQVEAHIVATLAGAEQGADAYSGQVTTLNALSFQLQATESGQDQFQGAAAALAQGTLLAQETGQDSYQGSVAAPVQADLSAQEVGADVYSGAASVDEEPVLDGVLAALSTTETGVDLAGFSIRSNILVKAGALEAGADALEMQAQLSVQAALNALESGADEYRSVTDVVEVYRVKFKVNLPDAVGYTVDIPDRQRFDIRVM